MNELDKLIQDRAALLATAGALYDASKADGGSKWTAEDEAKFNKIHDDADKLQGQIQAVNKAGDRQRRHEAAQASLAETAGRRTLPTQPAASATGNAPPTGFVHRGRTVAFRPGSPVAHRATPQYGEAFATYMGGGYVPADMMASLTTDIATEGGYLAPPQYVAELVKELDNTFWFRQLARVLPPTSAPKVTMPRRTGRINSFSWGTEISPPLLDTGLRFGSYELTPHYMTAEIEVSQDLVKAASMSVDAIVRDEILWGAADLEEQAFLYGDGVNKPLGVFVPSLEGIDVGQDVSGDDGAFETYVDAKLSLRESYLRSDNLRWLFSRYSVRELMKLKSTTGEPIFLPSIREGGYDTLLGVKVVLSEYVRKPANGTAYVAGEYLGVIGDFRAYDVLDSLDMGIKMHMDSYYDRRNMYGYITRRKVDGHPRFAEAFKRVKKA